MRVRRLAGGGVATDPEEDQLIGVALQLIDGDDEAEVIKEEELQLQLVQLVEGESSDL